MDVNGNKYYFYFREGIAFDPEFIDEFKRWFRQRWGRTDGPINPRRQRRTQEEYDYLAELLTAEIKRLVDTPPSKKKAKLNWDGILADYNAHFAGRVFPKGTPYAHTDDSVENAKSDKRKTLGPVSDKDELFQKREVKATMIWVGKCAALKKIRDGLGCDEEDDQISSQHESEDEELDVNQMMAFDEDITLPMDSLNPIAEAARDNGFGGIFDAIRQPSVIPRRLQNLSRRSLGRNPSNKGKKTYSKKDPVRYPKKRLNDEEIVIDASQFDDAFSINELENTSPHDDLDSDSAFQIAHAESLETAGLESNAHSNVPRLFEIEPQVITDMEITIHNIIQNFRGSWPMWTDEAEQEANVAYAMATADRDLDAITPILDTLQEYLEVANAGTTGSEDVVDGLNTVRQRRFRDAEEAEEERMQMGLDDGLEQDGEGWD